MQEQKRLNIIKKLIKDVDFNAIANYINATKGQLTKKNERHFASTLRDNFFEKCSFSNLEYIDKNRVDLNYKEFNQKIEIKYLTNGFLYSLEKKIPREVVNEIKLINTDSKNKIDVKDCQDTIILCCEPNCFSLLFWSDLIKYNLIDHSKPGQVLAKKIPRKLFYQIINHQEFDLVVEHFNLQERKDEFVENTIQDFLNLYKNNLYKKSNDCKMHKPQKEKDNKMNLTKDGSTKKSYELILSKHDHDKLITAETIQKLLKDTGLEKSIGACRSYISSLKKTNKIIISKKQNNKFFYRLNKNHKDYLNYVKNKTKIKDISENFTNEKLTEKLVNKVLESKFSKEIKNKILYEII